MARALVAFLLLGFASLALSHSWLECTDWRLKDPSKPSWLSSGGTCHGYARRFPIGMNRPYGDYDNIEFFRHYDQGANPDSKPPCGTRRELRANPISGAYAPNRDERGHTMGAMTRVAAGGLMCWTWPAKNHQHESANQYVMVNWAPQPGADPSQAVFSQNTIARMLFKNCSRYPGLDYGTSYQNTKEADDNQPCGGCFTVPNRAPGIYSVQWRWQLDIGEVYTSCSDIEVTAGQVTPPPEEEVTTAQTSSSRTTRVTSQLQETTEPTVVTNVVIATTTKSQNVQQTSAAVIQNSGDVQADATGLVASFIALLVLVAMLV